MALTIENPETERLARELAAQSGVSVEQIVIDALKQALSLQERRERIHKAITKIQEEVSKLPVLDDRSPDEILGYDEAGLPH